MANIFSQHSRKICVVLLSGLLFSSLPALANPLPPQFAREEINVFITKPARIDALRRGILAMQQKPATDPTSWAFQSNVHGSVVAGQYWNQCQHRHWWFLAWHRAYLYYLERMLQRAANESRLRIPYWNYTNPVNRSLPALFMDPTTVFYVPGRNLTSPADQVTPSSVNITQAMSRTAFIGSNAQLGFGGGQENAPVQFPFENKAGTLETLPHNAIHVQVGGLMQNPSTAATDPVFWIHHSNIDRLWVNWLASGGGRANPVDPAFLNATFQLYNEDGVLVTHTVADFVGDTSLLGYFYDDAPPPQTMAMPQGRIMLALSPESDKIPASQDMQVDLTNVSNLKSSVLGEVKLAKPAQLLAQPTTIPVQMQLQLPEVKSLLRKPTTPTEIEKNTHYMLVLDDIQFDKTPTNIYEVYLNLPTANFKTDTDTQYHVGVLSFFEPNPGEGAHGAHHATDKRSSTFDITDLINSLRAEGKLNLNKLTVTVVPVGIIKNGEPSLPSKPVALRLSSFKIVMVRPIEPVKGKSLPMVQPNKILPGKIESLPQSIFSSEPVKGIAPPVKDSDY